MKFTPSGKRGEPDGVNKKGGNGMIWMRISNRLSIGCYKLRYVIKKFPTTSLRNLIRDEKSRLAVFFAISLWPFSSK